MSVNNRCLELMQTIKINPDTRNRLMLESQQTPASKQGLSPLHHTGSVTLPS